LGQKSGWLFWKKGLLLQKKTMNRIIIDKMPQLVMLCKKYRVETMYLFGSAATDAFHENSDVDFLISFQNDVSLEEYADNYFDLLFEMEDIFEQKVDLVTEKTLSNPYFIRSIEQTKKLIYAA
jgi:predicted nucleotidyltransferase